MSTITLKAKSYSRDHAHIKGANLEDTNKLLEHHLRYQLEQQLARQALEYAKIKAVYTKKGELNSLAATITIDLSIDDTSNDPD